MDFSVITPSFQNSDWLKLCVASVADQQGITVEHIVQDAGSTDGTLDWLPSDSRVKAFVEKDSGMYDAINRGLQRATGKILAYLNCDEQYLPQALALVYRFFDTNPEIEVLFTDAILLNRTGKPISYRRVILPNRQHIRHCHLNTLSCGTFFKSSVIRNGHLFDPQWKAIGDNAWVDDLLKSAVPMACLHKPCSAFAFTGSNLGQADDSMKESARWRSVSPPFLVKIAIVAGHRLRKALAAAYWPRRINTELYTMKSQDKRQLFKGVNVGFGWPPIGVQRAAIDR